MNDYDPGFPTWRHRRNAFGQVESQVFNSNEVPKGKGWVDSMTKIADAPEPIPEPEFHVGSGETLDVGSNPEPAKTKRRPGRPRKVKDGDDS